MLHEIRTGVLTALRARHFTARWVGALVPGLLCVVGVRRVARVRLREGVELHTTAWFGAVGDGCGVRVAAEDAIRLPEARLVDGLALALVAAVNASIEVLLLL